MEIVNQPCAKTLEEYEKRMLALKDAIEILSGKWKFCILLNLNQYEPLRISLLKEACKGITPKGFLCYWINQRRLPPSHRK